VTAILVVSVVVSIVTWIGVLAMFIWAARKDGEEDRALQARLGIRRRAQAAPSPSASSVAPIVTPTSSAKRPVSGSPPVTRASAS